VRRIGRRVHRPSCKGRSSDVDGRGRRARPARPARRRRPSSTRLLDRTLLLVAEALEATLAWLDQPTFDAATHASEDSLLAVLTDDEARAAMVELLDENPDEDVLARGAELRQKFAERTSGRWLKKRLIVGATLYQLQFMRCGQKRCKRCHGDHDDPTRAHGPYWVAYTTKSERGGAPGRGGRWKLRYIGKDPSGEGPEFLEALARAR
jgi:hypothetical protein